MNSKKPLFIAQRGGSQGEDLVHILGSQNIRSARTRTSMNHNLAPRPTERAVQFVGIPEVHPQMVPSPGSHPLRADVVESFGGLLVPFPEFRPELPRKITQSIYLEKLESAPLRALEPDFELFLLFENTNKEIRSSPQAHPTEFGIELGSRFLHHALGKRRFHGGSGPKPAVFPCPSGQQPAKHPRRARGKRVGSTSQPC